MGLKCGEIVLTVAVVSILLTEIDVVFSFLPIMASVWFGSFWVFLITSTLAAVFDLMFVMMQRFNRTRIMKMNEKRIGALYYNA